MKKIILYLILLALNVQLWGQNQEEKSKAFMLQCKHGGMYLCVGDNGKPHASPDVYGHYFNMQEGSLTSVKDLPALLYLENNQLVMKYPPKLSEEKRAEYNEQERIRAAQREAGQPLSPNKVELPKIKSAWYFEPAGDNSVYLVFPYEPFEGMVLTVTNVIDTGKFNVELKPREKTLEDRQKWQFVLVP